MTYQVKTEKLINRSTADVFQATGEGRLFLNCGAEIKRLSSTGANRRVQNKKQPTRSFSRESMDRVNCTCVSLIIALLN